MVAISISKEQISFANSNDLQPDELAFLRVLGLSSTGKGSFEIRFQDYRDLGEEETFDRIVSVGMFEHVGPKYGFIKIHLCLMLRSITEIQCQINKNSNFLSNSNYGEFFQICRRCLKDEGILLLHTIGFGHTTVPQVDAWTNK